MKQFLLYPFLFLFLAPSILAQNYLPLLGNVEWKEKFYDFSGEGCWDFILDPPEVVPGIGTAQRITNSDYLLWEDTLTQQVWYFRENSNMTTPSLLYDFSLSVGDMITMPSQLTNQTHTLTVVEEGTESIFVWPFEVKKLTLLSSPPMECTEQITWITGVGSNIDMIYPRLFCDPVVYLDKVWKDNVLIYDAMYDCTVNIEEINQNTWTIWYYNDVIHVQEENNKSGNFTLYSIDGHEIVQEQNISTGSVIKVNIPAGIYVGVIEEVSGTQQVKKLVIP